MKKIKWEKNPKAEQVFVSDDFWYALTAGGYIRPVELLDDPDQLSMLQDAIYVVKSFEAWLDESGLVEYS